MNNCEACAFSYDELPLVDVPTTVRALAAGYVEQLRTADDAAVRKRPAPTVWSALEYACHVRDVLRMQAERIVMALEQDDPDFVPMDREARVIADRYNEQSPAAVAGELAVAAEALAGTAARLDDAGWRRTGVYHWPTTESRPMSWVARHTVHELLHHQRDIDAVLAGELP